MNDFLRKWKKWSLTSKLTALGTIVGVLSFVYVLVWDAYKLVDEPKSWEANKQVLDKLWKSKKYLDMSHYLKNMPRQENNDLQDYYSAIVSMYHETDLGGNKAERLLRKIRPESSLYINAQKRRLMNAKRSGNSILIQNKILRDMEGDGGKNYYYYLLRSLFAPPNQYADLSDVLSDMDLYYKKIKFSSDGKTSSIDAGHLPSKSVDLKPIIFRDLVYYVTYMKLAVASNLVCNPSGVDNYNKAVDMLQRNEGLSFQIRNAGFKDSLIDFLDSMLLSSEKQCKNKCKNITNTCTPTN